MITIGRFVALMVSLGLVDVELHAVEFAQQVVREFDVGLVDFVDQQHRSLCISKLPTACPLDVVADVLDAGIAELAVAQARHRVVFVEALLRLGGGLDVPGQQRAPSALATSSASTVLPVPGSPLTSSGRRESRRR
jgi:hypothetical protein